MSLTKYLHKVKQATKGERIVWVGWINSQIAKDDEREDLYLIKRCLQEITGKYGHTSETTILGSLSIDYTNVS